MKNNNEVYVLCYGSLEKWSDKKKAIDLYKEGFMACDGSEKERYAELYYQLKEGYKYTDDGKSDYVLNTKFSLKDLSIKEKLRLMKEYNLSFDELEELQQKYEATHFRKELAWHYH